MVQESLVATQEDWFSHPSDRLQPIHKLVLTQISQLELVAIDRSLICKLELAIGLEAFTKSV